MGCIPSNLPNEGMAVEGCPCLEECAAMVERIAVALGAGAREPPIDVKSYLWGVSGVETAGESIRSHWGAHSYQATRFE